MITETFLKNTREIFQESGEILVYVNKFDQAALVDYFDKKFKVLEIYDQGSPEEFNNYSQCSIYSNFSERCDNYFLSRERFDDRIFFVEDDYDQRVIDCALHSTLIEV